MKFDFDKAAEYNKNYWANLSDEERDFIEKQRVFMIDINERERAEQLGITDKLDYVASTGVGAYYGTISGLRGAIIPKEKRFLDKDKIEPRVAYKQDSEGLIFKMNHGELLSDLLDQLPHGLIDKKATGIGATTLEIKSKRNSIIVLPTRILAKSKADKENDLQGKKACLFVGTKDNNLSTSIKEINDYIDNTDIQHKNFLVVADSLKKVIQAIQDKKIDVYREYFLMVDEIDIMQSDSNYRPQLENVIDYYLKFKVQKRALVSATVGEFSHTRLYDEKKWAYTSIIINTPQRSINKLLHTNNIHKSVSDEISKRLLDSPDDKILIAYNSIEGIQKIINLLDEPIQLLCGILCSEASEKEVGAFYTKLTDSKLERQITFMTCAYFTGIDIEDKCHLITVSNIRKAYSILPLNRITQIYGRCRNGVLSDTIIYSSNKNKFYFNIDRYREELKYKAEKIISLLNAADDLVANEEKNKKKLIKKLFKRIKHLIIERADEKLFSNTVFRLIRENVFDKSDIQPAYFNIDALCEKMTAYSKIYSHKEGLLTALLEQNYIISTLSSDDLEKTTQQKEKDKNVGEKRTNQEDEDLKEAKENVIGLYHTGTLDQRIDKLIRFEKRHIKTFYERVKRHYQYIDINVLCDKLLINSQCKAYRNLNNAISFWVLDKNHPFKLEIREAFKRGRIYTSEKIAEELNPIINRYFYKTISQSEAVGLFKSMFETERKNTRKNLYKISGKNPLKLPNPLDIISKHELQLEQFFEIINPVIKKK